MTSFKDFNLPEKLLNNLKHMEYENPTPIQEKAIPLALEGKDIIGTAQTGTGKTAAFAVPLIAKLMENSRGIGLILLPTRELAIQVHTVIKQMLGRKSLIQTALLIGGDSMVKQLQQIKRRPRLIVGTPGRINDHLNRGNLMLFDANFLVLDEADRMLDMGFSIQLDEIAKYLPKVKQTLLFTATLSPQIKKLSAQYTSDAEHISIGTVAAPAENIDHKIIRTAENKKYSVLFDELDKREGTIIVFVKTQRSADKLAAKLHSMNYSVDCIHGGLKQNQRERVIRGFRNEKYRILVATDVAARGLDVPHVMHVINYNVPQAPEDYIHRIGRTARAGSKGNALCLLSPEDGRRWRDVEKLLYPDGSKDSAADDFEDYGAKISKGQRFVKGKPFNKTKSKGKRFEKGGKRDDNRRDRDDNRGDRNDRNGGKRFEGRRDRDDNRGDRNDRNGGKRFEGRRNRDDNRGDRNDRNGSKRFEGRRDRDDNRGDRNDRNGGKRFDKRNDHKKSAVGENDGLRRRSKKDHGNSYDNRVSQNSSDAAYHKKRQEDDKPMKKKRKKIGKKKTFKFKQHSRSSNDKGDAKPKEAAV